MRSILSREICESRELKVKQISALGGMGRGPSCRRLATNPCHFPPTQDH